MCKMQRDAHGVRIRQDMLQFTLTEVQANVRVAVYLLAAKLWRHQRPKLWRHQRPPKSTLPGVPRADCPLHRQDTVFLAGDTAPFCGDVELCKMCISIKKSGAPGEIKMIQLESKVCYSGFNCLWRWLNGLPVGDAGGCGLRDTSALSGG